MLDPVKTVGDPLIGAIVDDRYRILRVIGRGGMGVVYEAEATRLGDRPCAVKVLLPEFTRNEVAVARFRREAQVAARIKHPNVVEIFDTGATPGGLGYIAMELLGGESLDRLLRREGPLPWPRVRRIVLQICRALAAAHAQKIVHRDMKPENCFVCPHEEVDDFIKLLDFGIAKKTSADAAVDRLTATNSVVGTYAYMAFEQVRGEEVDARADVWAVGVILYELLTGMLPFRGSNQGQIWTAITQYDPEPLQSVAPDAGIPDAAEAIVRQALAKPLVERYGTIEALARAVAAVTMEPVAAVTVRRAGAPRATGIDPLATTGNMPPTEAERASRALHAGPGGGEGPARADTDEVTRMVPSPGTNPEAALEAPSLRGAMVTANVELRAEHPGRGRRVGLLAGVGAFAVVAAIVGWQLLGGGHASVSPVAVDVAAVQVNAPPAAPKVPVVAPEAPPGAATRPTETPPAVAAVAVDAAPESTAKVKPGPTGRRPAAKPIPEVATLDHLRSALQQKRRALDACRDNGGYAGMRLQYEVTVAPSGAVTEVGIKKPYTATDVGACVAEVIRGLKLPRVMLIGELQDVVTL